MKGFQIFFFFFLEAIQESDGRRGKNEEVTMLILMCFRPPLQIWSGLWCIVRWEKTWKHRREKKTKKKTIDSHLCVRLHQITNQRLPQGKVGILTLCGLAGSSQQKPDWDFHVLELKAQREHSHGSLCMYVGF